MHPQFNPEFLERIAAINWFHRWGQPDDLSLKIPHFYVKSWQKAEKLYRDVQWGRIEYALEENVFGHLQSIGIDVGYAEWDRLAQEARGYVHYYVTPLFQSFVDANGLDHHFTASVERHITSSIVEDTMADANLPMRCYAEILAVYEAGHFPCGWKGGDWEHGRLAIL